MTAPESGVYIAGLFVWTWSGLRVRRIFRARLARRAVERRVNAALEAYREMPARVEFVAGVRCEVRRPARLLEGQLWADQGSTRLN